MESFLLINRKTAAFQGTMVIYGGLWFNKIIIIPLKGKGELRFLGHHAALHTYLMTGDK
jgi:hypothetical protein